MMNKELIDFVLEHRGCIEKAIKEKREDADTRKVGGNGSGHCRISDPTAETAMRNIEPIGTVIVYYGPSLNGTRMMFTLPDSERWLSISNATWHYFRKTKCHKFMQMKYIEKAKPIEIRKALRIGRRRYFYIQKEIRDYAYSSAKGMHLRSADVHKHFARTDEILKRLKETGDGTQI